VLVRLGLMCGNRRKFIAEIQHYFVSRTYSQGRRLGTFVVNVTVSCQAIVIDLTSQSKNYV